jgi:hypothetical protein
VNLDLPLYDDTPGDLEDLLQEIDAALDAAFLGEVSAAVERAAAPEPAPASPAAA